MSTYTEPQVSFLVLDYKREHSARLCLESIRAHVKFPTKVIYCHNGVEDYPVQFLREGLIDELIMPRVNGGLGLGTRALFAACFSPYSVYWQADQIMGRDFEQGEVDALISRLDEDKVLSISLAGPVCGANVYSERAHFIDTRFYTGMEHQFPLTYGGAGPYHDVIWREEQIQGFYRDHGYVHDTSWQPLALDNGHDAIRQNPDGSVWRHYPDTKQLWLLSGPIKERFVYPKLSDNEWEYVLREQTWPGGRIPENEVKDSFQHWHTL